MALISEHLDAKDLLNPPESPRVRVDDEGLSFLVLEDGREYDLPGNPAAALRLINHLSQKAWADREFLELATLRICVAMGWWYPEDHSSDSDSDDFVYTLAKSEIIKRGWTRSMIDEFLGEPEMYEPHYKHHTDMHLYDYDRVVKKERSEEWENSFMQKLPLRVARSHKSLSELLMAWTKERSKQKRRRAYLLAEELEGQQPL